MNGEYKRMVRTTQISHSHGIALRVQANTGWKGTIKPFV
jgi:hypothetical protein